MKGKEFAGIFCGRAQVIQEEMAWLSGNL